MSDRMGNLLNVIKEYVEINNSKQHDEEED